MSSPENPAAFGNVVARRRALDQRKEMFHAWVGSETVNRFLERNDPVPNEYALIDTYQAVRQAIEILDDPRATRTRIEVLHLAALEFTLAEISEALGITTNNAKVLLSRARAKLREHREEYGL